jgi:hypothetical protein
LGGDAVGVWTDRARLSLIERCDKSLRGEICRLVLGAIATVPIIDAGSRGVVWA